MFPLLCFPPFVCALVTFSVCLSAWSACLPVCLFLLLKIRRPSVSVSILWRVLRTLTSLTSRSTQSVRLIPYVSSLVEVAMGVIDPQRPSVRKQCLAVCQKLLAEILKRFPMCAFHPPSQRFAVGTHALLGNEAVGTAAAADGRHHHHHHGGSNGDTTGSTVKNGITVYDLRTASKWRIFDGHESPVCCLSFSPSGDTLVSYSATDARVRTWKTGASGFFGSFQSLQTSYVKEVKLGTVSDHAFSPSHVLKHCKMEWATQSHDVLITRENGELVPVHSQ